MHHTSRRLGDQQITDQLRSVLARSEELARRIQEEFSAKWTAEKRKDAEKKGDALPGGKFPIVDQEDMDNAAGLIGNSSLPRSTVVAHMKKQAKKHGLKLPQSLQS